MSRLSPRFGAWITVLFAVIAVPVLYHASARASVGCVDALATPPGAPEERRPGGITLRYEVTVTGEPWQFYGWPPRQLSIGTFPGATLQRNVAVDGDVLPVRWDTDDSRGYSRVRGYFLVFDGRPVASLFRASLAAAGRQLLGGRLPAARVMVYAEGPLGPRHQLSAAVEERLIEGWRLFRRSCGP